MTVWQNGRLCTGAEARIDPADRGFTLGDGIFETIRAAAGSAPLLPRHLARLRQGLTTLGIPLVVSESEMSAAIGQILSAKGLHAAALRLTVSRGVSARGVLPQGPVAPTVLITAGSLPPALPPARLIIAQSTRRNEFSPLSRVKSLNYLDSILAKQEALARGADDALLLNTQGFVAEATAANLFVLKNGRLLTPPLRYGALPGITRGLLLELCGAEEAEITAADCVTADAIFLSNSLGLREVAAVNGANLPMRPETVTGLARRLGLLTP
jgi:branched-chain amino acid aminotransferase